MPCYDVERLKVYGTVYDSLRATSVDIVQMVYRLLGCTIAASDSERSGVVSTGLAELGVARGILAITREEYEDAVDVIDSFTVGYCREPYGYRCTWVAHECGECTRERECAGWKASLVLRGVFSP